MSVEKMSSSTFYKVDFKGNSYGVTELFDAMSDHKEFEVYDEEGNAVYDDAIVSSIIKEIEAYRK